MTEHELKIEEAYYNAVKSGEKTFEIRYNDRGYQKGDLVKLMAIRSVTGYYTNAKPINAEITYVSNYAQKRNWVVFSIKIKD